MSFFSILLRYFACHLLTQTSRSPTKAGSGGKFERFVVCASRSVSFINWFESLQPSRHWKLISFHPQHAYQQIFNPEFSTQCCSKYGQACHWWHFFPYKRRRTMTFCFRRWLNKLPSGIKLNFSPGFILWNWTIFVTEWRIQNAWND